MPDENENTNNNNDNPPQGNSGDAAALGKQVADLTKKLTQAQAKVKELEGSNGGLTTANKKANEQLSAVQAELDTTKELLEAKTGETTNLQTQLEQVQTQVSDLTAKNGELTKQTELFGQIAKNPDLHGLVGSFEALSKVVSPEASAEDVQTLLKSMAGDAKSQVDKALEMFRAGGSPPANHGGQPTDGAPKTKEEAWAILQSTPITDGPAYQKAMQQFQALSAGDGQQPN
jgi:hypothetical protein